MKNWKDGFDDEEIEFYKHDMEFTIQQSGDYTANHICVIISEEEIVS